MFEAFHLSPNQREIPLYSKSLGKPMFVMFIYTCIYSLEWVLTDQVIPLSIHMYYLSLNNTALPLCRYTKADIATVLCTREKQSNQTITNESDPFTCSQAGLSVSVYAYLGTAVSCIGEVRTAVFIMSFTKDKNVISRYERIPVSMCEQ